MTSTQASIHSISPLTNHVIRVELKPEHYIHYDAGQYLQIKLPNASLAYSIANAPLDSRLYELQIRHTQANSQSMQLLDAIKNQDNMTIELPFGECHIHKLMDDKPIIFIAAGTGFAPIKAMIEQLLADDDSRHFELYWSARTRSDLYLDDKIKLWAQHTSRFQYFQMVSQERNKRYLIDMILNRHGHSLNNHQYVLAGPFDMVYQLADNLKAKGLSAHLLFSDAFSFLTPTDKASNKS